MVANRNTSWIETRNLCAEALRLIKHEGVDTSGFNLEIILLTIFINKGRPLGDTSRAQT